LMNEDLFRHWLEGKDNCKELVFAFGACFTSITYFIANLL